ncbi:FAD dependent oxidoreductase-domain-containing protein [Lanmaoa asiatica]|nr:FAD dependent oxidoreductase-domain-containing protein [Lanmaoa asiatica]
MRRISISALISVAVCAMATLPIALNEWENHQKIFSNNHFKPAGLPAPNPTRSFWAHSSPDANPLAREGSTGPLTTDADVCIIGSGITGVGVAYHLSEAIETNAGLPSPLKVVILEARDFCAGATGRNGGHLTPAAFSNFHARAAEYGPEEAKRSYALEAHTASSLVRFIQDHGWTHDVDLVHGGHIDLLFSDQEVEEARRDRKAAEDAGWSLDGVVTLSKEEVEATFGAHYPAVKIPGYNVWPLKLVTKLYQQAKTRTGPRFDLILHTHTPITAIENAKVSHSVSGSSTNASRAYTLSTSRGTIACSRVVHATNAYASHLLPFLAGPQGIVPVRGQVIATRASVGMDQIKTNGWAGNGGFEYWFPRPVKAVNERPLIILGGAREAARPAFEAYIDDDTTCHPKVGETLRAFLPAVFEGKFEPGREPEMEWTGIMAYTAIGDPFVGPVDKLPAAQGNDAVQYTGQFIAAGYSGHGMPRAFGWYAVFLYRLFGMNEMTCNPQSFSRALFSAEVVARMIVAELVGIEWTQPKWLPTRYLTWEERGTAIRN